MVRPCLSAGCRARLLLLPHLPCQACPDGHPCTPANSSSGSQGGPAARALHGEKANGLEPPGPLRILSKSQFFPALHSLSSFLLNLSGSSQKHFHPFHQTSLPSPSQRILPHPAPVNGLQERNGPTEGTFWSPVPISPQEVTQMQQAKRT